MKLFYYQPDGHGPLSLFVVAETAEAAAKAVNDHRHAAFKASEYPDYYSYGEGDFEADDFKVAEPGVVIENDNG